MTINNYFLTAHYLDQALKEFFTYLKKSGLYEKSMIVIYGDHYGLSNEEYTTLAPLIGKNPNDWSSYNTAQMQKVPFMIHASNLKGGIKSTLAGEIDVLPTILTCWASPASNMSSLARTCCQLSTSKLSSSEMGR